MSGRPSNKEPSFFQEIELVRNNDCVIVEDMCLIPRLQLVAYTVVKPQTSVIFIKSTIDQNTLLAELIGHQTKTAPCIMYNENSGCLISGDRWPEKSNMIAEILIWNL